MNTSRTCKSCGWVHCGVTREYAERHIADFNTFFGFLDENGKSMYGNKPSSMADYDRCFNCGGSYKNTKAFEYGDGPKHDGYTVQPILIPEDTL